MLGAVRPTYRQITATIALALILGAAAAGGRAGESRANAQGIAPRAGFIWCDKHWDWHEDSPRPQVNPMQPGVILPPGKVWVPEHGHFHDE
jgi:hypothetical protein